MNQESKLLRNCFESNNQETAFLIHWFESVNQETLFTPIVANHESIAS